MKREVDTYDPIQMAQAIADHVNSISTNSKEFCDAMADQHRTLQQSFTRLCTNWIIYCGSPEYRNRTDGRNEASAKLGQFMIESGVDLYLPLI